MSRQQNPTSQKPPRQCIFCQSTANSPEHLWSKWMAPHFDRTPHDESEAVSQQLHPQQPIFRQQRHGHPTTLKLKVVCRVCNNGWMSAVESSAKPFIEPMILGRRVTLDKAAQKSVATWIALKMMVFEQQDWTRAVFTRSQTLSFAMDRSPPEHFKIWLCRCQDSYAGVRMSRGFASLFKSAEEAVGKAKNANTQTVTFGIGQLIIFAVHSQLPDLDIGRVRQSFAKQLWPSYRASLTWPPMKILTAKEVADLALMLQQYLALPGMKAL